MLIYLNKNYLNMKNLFRNTLHNVCNTLNYSPTSIKRPPSGNGQVAA